MSAAGLVAIGNFYEHIENAYQEISGRTLKLTDSCEKIITATLAHIDVCDICKQKITKAPISYQKIKEVVQHTLIEDPVAPKEPCCVCTIA